MRIWQSSQFSFDHHSSSYLDALRPDRVVHDADIDARVLDEQPPQHEHLEVVLDPRRRQHLSQRAARRLHPDDVKSCNHFVFIPTNYGIISLAVSLNHEVAKKFSCKLQAPSLNHVDSGTGNPSATQGRRALSPTHRVTAVRSGDVEEDDCGSTRRGGTTPSGSVDSSLGFNNAKTSDGRVFYYIFLSVEIEEIVQVIPLTRYVQILR